MQQNIKLSKSHAEVENRAWSYWAYLQLKLQDELDGEHTDIWPEEKLKFQRTTNDPKDLPGIKQ